MNKLLCFIILVVLLSCSEKKSEQKDEQLTVTKSDKNWTDFNTKDSIPSLLNKTLNGINKGDFELANPNERFNSTDVILDSLPKQKMSLLSKKGNKWRLTYIQGGFGKYYVYVQCKIKNDSIYDLEIAESILKLDNNDSIDKYLKDKELKPTTLKIVQQ